MRLASVGTGSDTRKRHRPFATESGILLALSASPAALAPVAHWPFAALVALCLLAGGLTILKKPKWGRRFATAGLLGLLSFGLPLLTGSPSLFLVAGLLGLLALSVLWDITGYIRIRRPMRAAQAHGAALAALLYWFAASLLNPTHTLFDTLPAAFAFLVAAGLGLRWTRVGRRDEPRRSLILVLAVILCLAFAAATHFAGWSTLSAGALYAVIALFTIPPSRRSEIEPVSWWEPFLEHAERLLVGTFAFLSVTGTILLALPLSASSGVSIGILDAAFTAVSAVCVTGLTVLDTPVAFSLFGQFVLLVLIQIGGLGIMTFSTAVLRILGRRMSLRHEGAVASLISTRDRGQLFDSTRRILTMTFVAEAAGAVLLFLAFLRQGDSLGLALWRAVFTSVSAFCNAGFALQSTSLIPYQADPLVLHVTALLIIIGGLSPLAVYSIPPLLRRTVRPIPAQAKIGLGAAAFLLLLGFVAFLALEWDGAFAHLAWPDKLHNAWFQSVTLRTAGFNSVDFAVFQPAAITLCLVLMFIGGAAGGTAGGIKTTTVAVLLLSAFQIIRGSGRVEIFSRQISERSRHRAAAIVVLSIFSFLLALVGLQLTQSLPAREAVFEVVSALGTVGLTIGATAKLDEVGKVIILVCMFIGRVGGLSLLMFMSQRNLPSRIKLPEEEIEVG